MKVTFDTKKFDKEISNILKYTEGFFDGVQSGKNKFLQNIGATTVQGLKDFIDSMAKLDPAMLHHVYEWDRVGSPGARLFDIDYSVGATGLSVNATLRQSISIQNGSTVPFYNKAKIMEEGIPVTIKPKSAKVLRFNSDGEEVFTPNKVVVQNPGGQEVVGGFEKAWEMFMTVYFRQSFLRSSGILDKLKDLSVYKNNLAAGAKSGRSKGLSLGYNWIANVGVID